MSRIILIGSFAALLLASGTQSANAIESANQTAWAQARLACADVGIDPGSSVLRMTTTLYELAAESCAPICCTTRRT